MRPLVFCILLLSSLASAQPASTAEPASTAISLPTSTAAAPQDTTPSVEPIPTELLPFLPLVDAKISVEAPRLGDMFLYELCAERLPEVRLQFPEISWPEGLRLRQEKPKTFRDAANSSKTECRSYELQVVGLGEIVIPAPLLRFSLDGKQRASVAGPSKRFQIDKTLSEATDIKDTFTPRPVPDNPTNSPFWILGVVLAVFIGTLVWVRLRRNRSSRILEQTKPHETTALSSQEGTQFWQSAARQIRQEMSTQLDVLNASPREILQQLSNSTAFDSQRERLLQFWSAYELFLFSGKPITLSREEVLELVNTLSSKQGVSP